MVTLGIILLLIGIFLFHPLLWVGIVLLLIGLIIGGVGYSGHLVYGRRHWF